MDHLNHLYFSNIIGLSSLIQYGSNYNLKYKMMLNINIEEDKLV